MYEGERCGPVSAGCVAGDAQSYILFCDFFDRVIEAYHKHKVDSQTPNSDFNHSNLKVGWTYLFVVCQCKCLMSRHKM